MTEHLLADTALHIPSPKINARGEIYLTVFVDRIYHITARKPSGGRRSNPDTPPAPVPGVNSRFLGFPGNHTTPWTSTDRGPGSPKNASMKGLDVMDEQDSGRRPLTPIVLLLIFAVILNFYTLWSVRQVAGYVEGMQSHLSVDMRTLGDRLDNVSMAVNRIDEETTWYDRPRIDVAAGTGEVKIDWTFRELGHDAEVTVEYRIADREEWHSARISPGPGLAYRAIVPIPDDLEPVVQLGFQRASTDEGRGVRVEAGGTDHGGARLEYIITARDESGIRTGGREHLDLGRLGGIFHGNIREIERNRRFSFDLHGRAVPSPGSAHTISEVYFVAFHRGVEVVRAPLEPKDESWAGSVELSEESEIDEVGFLMVTEGGREMKSTLPFD